MHLEIGQAFCQSLVDMIEKEQIKVSVAIKELKRATKKGGTQQQAATYQNIPNVPVSPDPKLNNLMLKTKDVQNKPDSAESYRKKQQ